MATGFANSTTNLHDAEQYNKLHLQRGATGDIDAAAANNEGVTWWDTTLEELVRSDGATNVKLFGSNEAAGVRSLRKLGTGSLDAAAGDHGHA